MTEWIIHHEGPVRLSSYLIMLGMMLFLEHQFAARPSLSSKLKRWANNILLSTMSGLFTRYALPILATGAALWASEHGIGLFNQLEITAWISVPASIILLDLIVYWQHRITHALPILWRLHAVHHADKEVDASTGGRFHPLEIALSMLLKIGVVVALGCPVFAVILFEVLLNASATFNHSNIRLHPQLERFFRYWLVTPAVHRIHHSVIPRETDSNFGFFLIIWDKLFNTFNSEPEAGEHKLLLGLPLPQDMNTQFVGDLLIFPFRYQPTPKNKINHPT
jgi:sterol desaturase/sphingolipid hydroxylase (fatty acid hydroxylase superfamily)